MKGTERHTQGKRGMKVRVRGLGKYSEREKEKRWRKGCKREKERERVRERKKERERERVREKERKKERKKERDSKGRFQNLSLTRMRILNSRENLICQQGRRFTPNLMNGTQETRL